MPRSFTSPWNASVFATKSVSQFTSIRTPSFDPGWMYADTTPSRAVRPARLAAAARPFFRRYSTAACTSSLLAASASLQSMTPAPVRSRNSLTCWPLAIGLGLLLGGSDHLGLPAHVGRLFGLVLAQRAAPFEDGVGDARGDQAHGSDGVVVPRNWIVDPGWITVGVHDSHDRNAQPLGFGHRDLLLARIDDEDGGRQHLHALDADQCLLQLLALAVELERLLLRQALEFTGFLHLLDLLEAADRLSDRLEVRERPAQPPLIDVEHSAAAGLFEHRVLGLLLGADEEHVATAGGRVANEAIGLAELLEGLLEIDDVDAVALSEDVLLHLRVPALGLVAEMHSGLQQFLHCQGCHVSSFGCSSAALGIAERPTEAARRA